MKNPLNCRKSPIFQSVEFISWIFSWEKLSNWTKLLKKIEEYRRYLRHLKVHKIPEDTQDALRYFTYRNKVIKLHILLLYRYTIAFTIFFLVQNFVKLGHVSRGQIRKFGICYSNFTSFCCFSRSVRLWLLRDSGQYWPSVCHYMNSAATAIHYCHSSKQLFIGKVHHWITQNHPLGGVPNKFCFF